MMPETDLTTPNLEADLAGWQESQHAAAADPRDPRVRDHQLREAYFATKAEADRAMSLRPPVDEIVANAHALVDVEHARLVEEYGYTFTSAASGDFEPRMDGSFNRERPAVPFMSNLFTPLKAILLFAPELMKAHWEAIIRATVKPEECGTPHAGRVAERETAEARAQAIAREHTRLVDAAAKLDPPVILELLPAEKARRDREVLEARRQATAREAQRELEQQVDTRDEQRRGGRRVGESSYLAAQRADRPTVG
jgi:hypothetical protein